MLRINTVAICIFVFMFSTVALGQPVVPSKWEGRATGEIHGSRFDVPVAIELRPPLEWEKNPFHLFVGTPSVEQIGAFGLVSATEMGTGGAYKVYSRGNVGVYDRTVARSPGRGNVTLQYLSIEQTGNSVSAVLSNTQKESAAATNMFTGPNVSAMEASDLMRDVMRQLGETEMFTFAHGATVRLQFGATEVNGTISGVGRSVLNTSSDVPFRCSLSARRVK